MSDLINVGELSRPATVLIERVSEAIGGIFKPYQMVRVARAEAAGELIRAEAEIEVTDLHRRAFRRFLNEEAKKQANIEEVTRKALPNLATDAKPEDIEDDWLAQFFDKCRLVSDDEMQLLWSRVLAGEANERGSFSTRTINSLSSLDKREAELFTSLCAFCWEARGLMPLVFDVQHEIYVSHGITFGVLMHLDSIGLIQFSTLTSFVQKALPQSFAPLYYGTPLELRIPPGTELDIGHVMLSQTGAQLAPICGSRPHPEFFDYVRSRWKSFLPKSGG